MGIVEELLKEKEEIIVKLIQVLEGKTAKARINLNGVQFKVGKTSVKLEGSVDLTIVPPGVKDK
ncbi:MAG: hypothetical protein HY367_00810 [Candidatus Aenigmarchaeota archaeon]|nr:hypothetical protein [Candidatus Aenigmarchaeota archaeon]